MKRWEKYRDSNRTRLAALRAMLTERERCWDCRKKITKYRRCMACRDRRAELARGYRARVKLQDVA